MARRKHNSRRNSSTPGWVWMMYGLGLGLLVAIGVYLRSPTVATAPAAAAANSAPAPVATPAAAPAPQPAAMSARTAAAPPPPPEPTESRFDFYEILPQFEVKVASTSVERGASSTANTARAQQPISEPGRYLLQAGSFSAAADADRRQANLALLGIESQVQRVTVDNNVRHRVRIGPTTDITALNKIRRQLLDAGIDAVVMRAPE